MENLKNAMPAGIFELPIKLVPRRRIWEDGYEKIAQNVHGAFCFCPDCGRMQRAKWNRLK
ncbi:hypothetical protein [Caldibacillus debilis]|uniref:hypothetical protein n=1 Tax=Caldibacillus debilis TaxID=301148 RepID=UPI0011C3CBF9|nr:hypothetical protein [Caldibacillus debilis]